jgi:hypothetical protein
LRLAQGLSFSKYENKKGRSEMEAAGET